MSTSWYPDIEVLKHTSPTEVPSAPKDSPIKLRPSSSARMDRITGDFARSRRWVLVKFACRARGFIAHNFQPSPSEARRRAASLRLPNASSFFDCRNFSANSLFSAKYLAMNVARIPRMPWLSMLLFGLCSLRDGAAETTPKFEPMNSAFSWKQLPPIPDQEGFAGSFAGVSNGALLVAGGANIIGQRWDNPIQKKWYSSLFVLLEPDGKWSGGFELPRPIGYGVSITSKHGLICAGGSDATRHFSEVFELQWQNGAVRTTQLPSRQCERFGPLTSRLPSPFGRRLSRGRDPNGCSPSRVCRMARFF